MIEILLGAKGTGKTNFLQKENASVIRNTALYATADSLVNDWSKQNVLIENIIDKNIYQGYTRGYVPVRIFCENDIIGKEIEVTITKADFELDCCFA